MKFVICVLVCGFILLMTGYLLSPKKVIYNCSYDVKGYHDLRVHHEILKARYKYVMYLITDDPEYPFQRFDMLWGETNDYNFTNWWRDHGQKRGKRQAEKKVPWSGLY